MSTTQEALNRASRLHEQHTREVDRIRGDTRLSAEAKRTDLARVFVRYRDELAAAQADGESRIADRMADLTRTAFGVPTDPIAAMSYRDALGRAEAITDPGVARYKLGQALETGDTLMAQALARHASEYGWSEVLGAYTAATPAADAALAELNDLSVSQNNVQQTLMAGAHFHAVAPQELQGLQAHQIDAVAAAPDAVVA